MLSFYCKIIRRREKNQQRHAQKKTCRWKKVECFLLRYSFFKVFLPQTILIRILVQVIQISSKRKENDHACKACLFLSFLTIMIRSLLSSSFAAASFPSIGSINDTSSDSPSHHSFLSSSLASGLLCQRYGVCYGLVCSPLSRSLCYFRLLFFLLLTLDDDIQCRCFLAVVSWWSEVVAALFFLPVLDVFRLCSVNRSLSASACVCGSDSYISIPLPFQYMCMCTRQVGKRSREASTDANSGCKWTKADGKNAL